MPDRAARPARRIAWWLALAALAAVTIVGASRLAFLCDDAFIHFRYAANAHAGHGIVWNPAPFRPVEGGGFLWILALWAAWSWFGVEPPDAANPILIGCGVLQLVVVALAARRICRRDGRPVPFATGLCALVAIVTNRTFLQWMTGGLDTAMFNVPLLAWVLHALRAPDRRGGAWLAAWSTFAALAALARPDGLPLVAATIGVTAFEVARRRVRPAAALAQLSPLLLVALHVAWRRTYYGEWLPNTFYAKVGTPWPESGLRYFACFALENGVWMWPPILLGWLLAMGARGLGSRVRILFDHVPALAAVGIAVFNAGYYSLVVGGDHFEYRVLAYLVPLGVLACVATTASTTQRAMAPVAVALSLAIANGVGWWHMAVTRHSFLGLGMQATAPAAPSFLRPLARWFDRQQAWLFLRYVGLRAGHHATLLELYRADYPHRLEIENPPDAFPMLATGAVGLPGYYLPTCAILDDFGLNDWVIARTPTRFDEAMTAERFRPAVEGADQDHDGFLTATELATAIRAATQQDPNTPTHMWVMDYLISLGAAARADAVAIDAAVALYEFVQVGRMMAHEKRPPPGYFDAFEPNVTVSRGIVTVKPRREPMTAERIRAIEAEWREKVLTAQRR